MLCKAFIFKIKVNENNRNSIHSLIITTITVWKSCKNGSLIMKGYPSNISFVDAREFNNNENCVDYNYITYEEFKQLDDVEILFGKLNNVLAISIHKI